MDRATVRLEGGLEMRSASGGRYDLVIFGAGWEAVFAARQTLGRGRRVAIVPGGEVEGTAPMRAPLELCRAPGGRVLDAPWCGSASALDRSQPGPTEGLAALLERLRPQGEAAPRDVALGRLAEEGIEVIRGPATFRGRDLLEVEGRHVPFRRMLLAMGSNLQLPDVPGRGQVEVLGQEEVAGLAEPPARLAVIGAGPRECFWAQALRRLGSEVHLIAHGATVLAEEDPDAAAIVQRRMERDGVRLRLGCGSIWLEKTGHVSAVTFARGGSREKLFVDAVLLGGEDRPLTAGLDLDRARVRADGSGVWVNDRLQTTNRRILAAGTVCGVGSVCPAALREMLRRGVDRALGRRTKPFGRTSAPRCVPTDPQIARLGLSPLEAAPHDLDVRTYRVEIGEPGHGSSGEPPAGFLAVHVRSRTGRIVGATVVAPRAAEPAAVLSLLMTRRVPLGAIAECLPCGAAGFDLLRRAAARCAEAQPCRAWSAAVEWVQTHGRRWRRRWGARRGTTAEVDPPAG